MPDYEKLYHKLFDDVTDTIEKLKQSQIDAVEMYLAACEKEKEEKFCNEVKIIAGKNKKI